jgi:uncharacterized C2H2 Zn-finger protein
MSYYECRRCLYKTKQKIDMSRHINRKIKCTRNIESYKYTDDELNILSMHIIKKNNNEKNQGTPKECIENKGIQGIYENNNIIKNLEIIEDNNIEIKNNECNEVCIIKNDNESNYINKCINCDKIFTRRSSLQRHLDKNRCKNIVYKTEQNITNITNNNTIIINVNIHKPLPFDSDWDVSQIDDTLKQVLLLSDLKYTKTLEHILENDVNLNVIIEDKADCGIVYKNDIEKFKPMKIEDIVDLSMNKLHKQLTIFHDEIKDVNKYKINSTILSSEKEILNEKYDEFKNNELTQKIVKNYIANIYNKKKEDTIKVCSELLELDKIEGY